MTEGLAPEGVKTDAGRSDREGGVPEEPRPEILQALKNSLLRGCKSCFMEGTDDFKRVRTERRL